MPICTSRQPLLPEPPHDRAVRPTAAAKFVGQVGMGVDLHYGHFAKVVGQSAENAVAAVCSPPSASTNLSRCPATHRRVAARYSSRVPSSGNGGSVCNSRACGEIDERFLVEQFHLAAGRDDGRRSARQFRCHRKLSFPAARAGSRHPPAEGRTRASRRIGCDRVAWRTRRKWVGVRWQFCVSGSHHTAVVRPLASPVARGRDFRDLGI